MVRSQAARCERCRETLGEQPGSASLDEMEEAALAALDLAALARDAADLVRVPSLTGDEQAAIELVAERADAAGLAVDLHRHDLAALRAHPDHPGEEAERDELWGVTATLPGSAPGRIALNGHIDVVGPGTEPWSRDPFSGAIEGDRLHGRGAVDMKGAVIAALHALAALRRAGVATPEVVLQAVPSEEDGGLGTFAALERDAAFDAALLPEPTGLTRRLRPGGRADLPRRRRRPLRPRRRAAARAARRSTATSACTSRFADHETQVNAGVAHPLMRELELPYPLLVGRGSGGEWSSQVPDRVEFEGRLGVPRRRRPRRGPRRAAGRGRPRAGRRRGALRAGLGGRRVRPGRDVAGRTRGSGSSAARCATSSAASRSWPAWPGAPTCGSSPRAASPP